MKVEHTAASRRNCNDHPLLASNEMITWCGAQQPPVIHTFQRGISLPWRASEIAHACTHALEQRREKDAGFSPTTRKRKKKKKKKQPRAFICASTPTRTSTHLHVWFSCLEIDHSQGKMRGNELWHGGNAQSGWLAFSISPSPTHTHTHFR